MGRYPFVTCLTEFLEGVKDYYAPSTLIELRAGLGHLHRVLQDLKTEGRVTTTDPKSLTKEDVATLMERKRANGIGGARQAWYLSTLDTFLKYHGNGAVGELKARRMIRPRPANAGPLPCPSADKVRETVEMLHRHAGESPINLAVFGVAALTAFAWVRPKEARLATVGDVAPDLRELLVLHPKGENRYAPPRRALIAPDGRAFVHDFLDLRAAMLKRLGVNDSKTAPLIPRVKGKQVGFYTRDGLSSAKRKVELRLGLRFTFRENRRAGGQTAIDLGADLSAVSRNLGHSTTVTTERHYARVKVDRAFEELERAYAAPKLNPH